MVNPINSLNPISASASIESSIPSKISYQPIVFEWEGKKIQVTNIKCNKELNTDRLEQYFKTILQILKENQKIEVTQKNLHIKASCKDFVCKRENKNIDLEQNTKDTLIETTKQYLSSDDTISLSAKNQIVTHAPKSPLTAKTQEVAQKSISAPPSQPENESVGNANQTNQLQKVLQAAFTTKQQKALPSLKKDENLGGNNNSQQSLGTGILDELSADQENIDKFINDPIPNDPVVTANKADNPKISYNTKTQNLAACLLILNDEPDLIDTMIKRNFLTKDEKTKLLAWSENINQDQPLDEFSLEKEEALIDELPNIIIEYYKSKENINVIDFKTTYENLEKEHNSKITKNVFGTPSAAPFSLNDPFQSIGKNQIKTEKPYLIFTNVQIGKENLAMPIDLEINGRQYKLKKQLIDTNVSKNGVSLKVRFENELQNKYEFKKNHKTVLAVYEKYNSEQEENLAYDSDLDLLDSNGGFSATTIPYPSELDAKTQITASFALAQPILNSDDESEDEDEDFDFHFDVSLS